MSSTSAKKANNSENGRWKKSEHDKFMKALEKYGRDWVKVQKMVKTRSLAQVRSHAQKTFLKMSDIDIEALIAPSDYDQSQNQIEKYVPVKRKQKDSKSLEATKSFDSSQKIGQMGTHKDSTYSEGLQAFSRENLKKDSNQYTGIHDHFLQENEENVCAKEVKNSGYFMFLLQENIEQIFSGGNFLNFFIRSN